MSFRLQLGPRAQAVIVLALVATVGALVGIAGDRLVAQQRAPADDLPQQVDGPPGPARPGDPGFTGGGRPPLRMPGAAGMDLRYAEGLGRMIELTPEQQTAIDSIVVEERRRVRELTQELEPRFREIAARTRQRVEAVLTPEQVEQLRTLWQQRARMLREQGPGQRPPGMRQRRPVAPDSQL